MRYKSNRNEKTFWYLTFRISNILLIGVGKKWKTILLNFTKLIQYWDRRFIIEDEEEWIMNVN
jgi:hypothetical protein